MKMRVKDSNIDYGCKYITTSCDRDFVFIDNDGADVSIKESKPAADSVMTFSAHMDSPSRLSDPHGIYSESI